MTRNGLLGIICGCAVFFAVFGTFCYWLERDTNKGWIACSTETTFTWATQKKWEETPIPKCSKNLPSTSLADYSFAPGENKLKKDDPLTCELVVHNHWYFDEKYWWKNDKSYAYQNCQLGRKA